MADNSTFSNLIANFDVTSTCMSGAYADFAWKDDPKHLLFTMARYKFCAKMLDGANSLLEIGCGDAFCAPLLLQSVNRMVGFDIVQEQIDHNVHDNKHLYGADRISYLCHNIIASPLKREYDAAVSPDVLEHIPVEHEDCFIRNIVASLMPHAVCIIGTPNIAAAPYASAGSVNEHINLKDSWR